MSGTPLPSPSSLTARFAPAQRTLPALPMLEAERDARRTQFKAGYGTVQSRYGMCADAAALLFGRACSMLRSCVDCGHGVIEEATIVHHRITAPVHSAAVRTLAPGAAVALREAETGAAWGTAC